MKYIDLFSGCGGLSLGFEAEGLKLALAVEKSPMAAETFYHNLIGPIQDNEKWNRYLEDESKQIKHKLYVGEIRNILDNKKLIENLKNIDIVAGGPPCQGFSLAGKRNPKDQRNELPYQFIKYIEHFKPKAFLMENVVGMRQNFKNHEQEAPFHQISKYITEELDYEVQELQLNAMHYGVAQHRPRVFLIGVQKKIAKRNKLKATDSLWNSSDYYSTGYLPSMCPMPTMRKGEYNTVQDAISDLHETLKYKNHTSDYINKINNVFKDNIKNKNKVPRSVETQLNHKMRNHSDRVINRFALYHHLSPMIFNLAANYTSSTNSSEKRNITRKINKLLDAVNTPLVLQLNEKKVIYHNKEDLRKAVFSLATKKHSQRALKNNAPSPTVVSIPDDVVHPELARTVTIREQARFQSFPDNFEFRGKETTGGQMRKKDVPQYTQVGNAIPPLLAFELAKHIKKLVKNK